MQRIEMLDREQVAEDVRPIYDALVKSRIIVPNMIRTVAHSPVLVKGFAAFMGALMGPGEVPQQLKELIAAYVSLKNNCHY